VWTSLGSDVDIAEEAVFATRPLVRTVLMLDDQLFQCLYYFKIKMLVSRRRRLFGAPFHFDDSKPKEESDPYPASVEIKSNPINVDNELHRLERSIGIQANAPLVDVSVQTNWSVGIIMI
jgi:hypothetical protein